MNFGEPKSLDAAFADLTVPQRFVYLLLSIPLTPIHGLVFSCLWNWFLVPLGLIHVSWIHMLGVGLVTYGLTSTYGAATKSVDSAFEYVVGRYMFLGVILLEGWIVHALM